MLLGFKTELKVNNTQRVLLAKHAGVARHAWNWGLSLTKNILDNNHSRPEEKMVLPNLGCKTNWKMPSQKTSLLFFL